MSAPPKICRRAWSAAIVWAAIILLTIPLARDIQRAVDETTGREAFTYGVFAFGVVALLFSVRRLRKDGETSWDRYLGLLVAAAIFFGYTWSLNASPEESVHFVEYGVLAWLLFRALHHQVRDWTIYLTTFGLGATVGIVDEFIQWMMPRRVWDLRDIGFNALGVGLVVLAIAAGLRPRTVAWRGPVTPVGVRWMTASWMAAVTLLGLCLANTPDRIQWYAKRIPGLAFLADNESLMIEYGYRYDDPEIGTFRSRFAPDELERTDRTRADEAARILDAYYDGSRYGDFLKTYTSVKDPFLHEARVHLFRRGHYHRTAVPLAKDDPERKRCMGIVFRENQIMEKYFPETLARSRFLLSRDDIAAIRAEAAFEDPYDSPVSRGLFTQVSEPVLIAGLVAMLIGLALLRFRLGRASAVLGLLLVACASPGGAKGSTDEPSLRIVFYTDVHTRTEYETPAALALAAERINGEHGDLVIAGGDVITDGFQSRASAVEPRWAAYLDMVARIRGGVRHVIGNHDLVAADPDDGSPPAADPRAVWRAKVGADASYGSFDVGGYHFVFLDSIEVGGPLRYRGYVSAEQLAWLERDLRAVEAGTPIVLATHIPLLTTFFLATEGSTTAAAANRVVVNNREVLRRFEGHDLILVLQGHQHTSEAIVWRGVTFLTGGALSGKWWRGPWHGTEEGFTVVELRGRHVDWRYVDIGWEAKRPASGP